MKSTTHSYLTGQELAQSNIVGLWADHNITDSVAYSQELRYQAETGRVHPLMAAFGLWADDTSLDNLMKEVRVNRDNQMTRPVIL